MTAVTITNIGEPYLTLLFPKQQVPSLNGYLAA